MSPHVTFCPWPAKQADYVIHSRLGPNNREKPGAFYLEEKSSLFRKGTGPEKEEARLRQNLFG